MWAQERTERAFSKRAARRAEEGKPERPHRNKDAPEGTRWCSNCQDFVLLADFSSKTYCKPCQSAYGHELRLQQYGITVDEYNALLAAQEGRCAICRCQPRKSRLSVDHNHKTDIVRGLLCHRCNRLFLGAAHESVEMLQSAIAYLTAPPAIAVIGERRAPGKPKQRRKPQPRRRSMVIEQPTLEQACSA